MNLFENLKENSIDELYNSKDYLACIALINWLIELHIKRLVKIKRNKSFLSLGFTSDDPEFKKS